MSGYLKRRAWLVVASLACLLFASTAQAASFDCAKAQTKVEKLVCDIPAISKLDEELGKTYQDVLSKATEDQKQHLIVEQKHWLKYTRNVCTKEPCFKHAYWSRLAELETFFEPKSPLYMHESDKAEAIKQVLEAPLYYTAGTDKARNQFCDQMFDDLKQMKDVRFVDPVIQVQSYEDPALDPWKKQCKSPFNSTLWCDRNLNSEDDQDGTLGICDLGYGLPPFKVFELPSLQSSGQKRYVFYSDDAYGPMSFEWKKPLLGGGFAGFQEMRCNSAFVGVMADAGQGARNGKNYNSIIEYKNQYYFLVLHERRSSYWLTIEPTNQDKPYRVCHWTPVKPNPSIQGSK